MDINELTIGQARELVKMLGLAANTMPDPAKREKNHWKIGSNYFIRTVTHIQIGELIEVTDKELILRNASWIADTGRFKQALKDGDLQEVEPFPDGEIVIVGRGALIDAVIWSHPLPREQK